MSTEKIREALNQAKDYIGDKSAGSMGFWDALEPALAELETIESILKALREVEWQRNDWLGFCVFRRVVGCRGTDGHTGPVGAPNPKPHDEQCPFSKMEGR
jgi:hypothetical protein